MTERQRDMATLVALRRHLRDNWDVADEWKHTAWTASDVPCLYAYALDSARHWCGIRLNANLAMAIYVSGMSFHPRGARLAWAASIGRRIHVMRHGRRPRALSVAIASARLAVRRLVRGSRFRIEGGVPCRTS